MFGLPVKTVIRGGIVLALLASFGFYTRWVYNSGVDSERRAVVERSLDRIAQGNRDDEDLRNTDLDGLCREYGATKWVPERNGCE